jgi:hypothetical protein
VLYVAAEGGRAVRKQRNMESGKKVAFTLERVELRMDDDLDTVTTCVVFPADVPNSTARRKRLDGYNQIAHQSFHDALKKHGCVIENSKYYPSSRQVVDANLCYDEFKLGRADDTAKPEAIRKRFNRARDWLQENDYIRKYEDKIWFIADIVFKKQKSRTK